MHMYIQVSTYMESYGYAILVYKFHKYICTIEKIYHLAGYIFRLDLD